MYWFFTKIILPKTILFHIFAPKHSFLRELLEVAPEMESFPEYHNPCEKYFLTKLLHLQSFQLVILQNYLYLKEYDKKVARHIFWQKLSPKHYFSKHFICDIMHCDMANLVRIGNTFTSYRFGNLKILKIWFIKILQICRYNISAC